MDEPALPAGRIFAFDGLRGLFAALVVLSHLAAVVYSPSAPQAAPSGLTTFLWYLGAPSVDAFFVLSGWVVADSLRRRPTLKAFYLARVRRLLPLGVIGALLGLLLARPLAARLAPELLGGFLPFLRQPLRVQDVLGVLSLGLFGQYNANRLNPPLWSLAIEVYASILMPLLLAMVRACGWWLLLAALPLLLFLSVFVPLLVYLPPFLFGVLLALHRPSVPKPLLIPLTVFGAVILFSRHIVQTDDVYYRWISSGGAALLLLGVFHLRPGWLEHPTLQWLGARSYALYVTHFPVLLIGVALLGSQIGVQLAAAVMLPATLVVAHLAQILADRLTPVRSAAPIPGHPDTLILLPLTRRRSP